MTSRNLGTVGVVVALGFAIMAAALAKDWSLAGRFAVISVIVACGTGLLAAIRSDSW